MIKLLRPSEELVASYLDFLAEMRSLGETIWEPWEPRIAESSTDFVQRLLRAEHSPEVGLVPESVYWAALGDVVVGRISLRHNLTPNLEEFGGHIGYEARPSMRRKGIAKEMLRQLLETTKAKDIGRLLLTCAPDNVASNRTIIANGGILIRTGFVERWQRQTNYYWIDVT